MITATERLDVVLDDDTLGRAVTMGMLQRERLGSIEAISFAYDRDYLAQRNGVAIDPQLRHSPRAEACAHGAGSAQGDHRREARVNDPGLRHLGSIRIRMPSHRFVSLATARTNPSGYSLAGPDRAHHLHYTR
ncbi:MAG: hypothetical protein KGJ32_03645 [Xanthomonadaceae bacterium]|nr:hypothetical protein [Xanthomonadaceae bacterium]